MHMSRAKAMQAIRATQWRANFTYFATALRQCSSYAIWQAHFTKWVPGSGSSFRVK